MHQAELEQIVCEVTRRVLEALGRDREAEDPRTEGLRRALILGGAEKDLPPELRRDTVLCGLEDFQTYENVLRYDLIIIASLDMTQLSDVAQGRMGDAVSRAILLGLLNGIDTWLLEDALDFRRYAGKGSTALYQLLEQYARTLQVFGVKPVCRARTGEKEAPPPRPPRFQAPSVSAPKGSARPNIDRLVTEAEALELIKEGGTVRLAAGAIVTPAARDVFARAGISLVPEH